MKDIIAYHGLKRWAFDKNLKSADALKTGPGEECAARLEYIKRRGGIMLLCGDPGVGKTLQLRIFRDGLNDNLFTPVYTPLSTLRGADLLRHLNDRLGLVNRASKAALYDQIQEYILDSREQRGRTLVLIIDEAHLLKTGALQELRLLTNFKMDSFDPFILILSGQLELRRTMDLGVMEAFSQRLALRYTMPPLNPTETAEYVVKQMKLAGAPEPIFSQDALKAVYEVSYGIPRRIGAACETALTFAMLEDKKTIDADLVLKAKAGG
jgi:type II secretory pathway predicted ATPase ExeA